MFKTALFLLVGIFLASSTMIPHIGYAVGRPVPRYSVNINASPRDKWSKIVPDFTDPLRAFVNDFTSLIPIPNFIYSLVGYWGLYLYHDKEYIEEVQAISEFSNEDFNKIFFINFFYELTSWKACTSIVARTADNRIVHGRNWDLEFFTYFAALSVIIDYTDDAGNVVASTQGIVGSPFFVTGIRHGAFAISMDTRHTGTIFNNMYNLFLKQYTQATWNLRNTILFENTFQGAVNRLNNTVLISGVYYIISGLQAHEGIVLERNHDGVHAAYQLNETTWYLVQTNYDRDQAEPWDDKRRHPAEKRMELLKDTLSEQLLLDEVLIQYPNFNIATIVSTTMSPVTGYFNTTKWY